MATVVKVKKLELFKKESSHLKAFASVALSSDGNEAIFPSVQLFFGQNGFWVEPAGSKDKGGKKNEKGKDVFYPHYYWNKKLKDQIHQAVVAEYRKKTGGISK
jgi:DNA-binding cell septation regulator SpoVG